MCGIYGQISDKPARAESGLSIRHRGPDDAGAQVFPVAGANKLVSLVHRRLSIIDLSPAGHQPMSNENDTVWIIFNGEIYNFEELRVQLAAAGHQFRSKTDTETLIPGYEEWGQEIVDLGGRRIIRSEEHTSELQSPDHLVCRLLLQKKKNSIATRLTTTHQ